MARKKESIGRKLGMLKIKKYIAVKNYCSPETLEKLNKQEARLLRSTNGFIGDEEGTEYFDSLNSISTLEAIQAAYKANAQMVCNYAAKARENVTRFYEAENEHNRNLYAPLLVFGKDEDGNYLDIEGQKIPTEYTEYDYSELVPIREAEIGSDDYNALTDHLKTDDLVTRLRQAGVALVSYETLDRADTFSWLRKAQQQFDRTIADNNRNYLFEYFLFREELVGLYAEGVKDALKEMRRWEYAAAVLEDFLKIDSVITALIPPAFKVEAEAAIAEYNEALALITDDLVQRRGKGSKEYIATLLGKAKESWLKPIELYGELPEKAVKAAVKSLTFEDIVRINPFTSFIFAQAKKEGVL